MKTKKITTMGMLAALAYISVLLCRIKLMPAADFLTYDPKDVIVAVTGFIFGPLYALLLTVVVSLLEMVTVSDTGIIGFVMNVLSTGAFALPAALIYARKKNVSRAVVGLIFGVICMTGTMLLWNYLITPIYQGVPREVVKGMLLPIFMPFNLLKSGMNMALTLIIYKPVVTALRKTGLIMPTGEKKEKMPEEKTESENKPSGRKMISTWIIGIAILVVCGVIMFLMRR